MKHRPFIVGLTAGLLIPAAFAVFPPQVGVEEAASWAIAPVRAESPPEVNFLTMGDWGTGSTADKAYIKASQAAHPTAEQRAYKNGVTNEMAVAKRMQQYVQKLSAQGTKFDATLLLGDNFYSDFTNNSESSLLLNDDFWEKTQFSNWFEKMYDPNTLKMPFFVAVGNHDYDPTVAWPVAPTSRTKIFLEQEYDRRHPESRWRMRPTKGPNDQPRTFYRVDFPPQNTLVTVFMLDSNADLSEAQWDKQLKWLQDELTHPAKMRGKWTILCAHHPIFSNGKHGDNTKEMAGEGSAHDLKAWRVEMLKHKIDFYLSGHDHSLQHLESPGFSKNTSFLVIGGGGRDKTVTYKDPQLKARTQLAGFAESLYGFAHLRFTSDRVEVKFLTPNQDAPVHQFVRRANGEVKLLP